MNCYLKQFLEVKGWRGVITRCYLRPDVPEQRNSWVTFGQDELVPLWTVQRISVDSFDDDIGGECVYGEYGIYSFTIHSFLADLLLMTEMMMCWWWRCQSKIYKRLGFPLTELQGLFDSFTKWRPKMVDNDALVGLRDPSSQPEIEFHGRQEWF